MSYYNNCPHCGATVWREYQGKKYRASIGVEIRGAYDGVLFHACPACWGTWHRWPKKHPLRKVAEKHAAVFTAEMRTKRSRPCSE